MLDFLKRKKEPENIKELLLQFNNLKKDFEKLSKEFSDLKLKNSFAIQKVGLVRFNPFKETGGNQSFSLALLDENDSGVIITSLYSRGESRFYGKTIVNGQSEYILSQEEKEALDLAKKRKILNNQKNNEQNTKKQFNFWSGKTDLRTNKKTTGSGGVGSY
jgi:hypothetical protein